MHRIIIAASIICLTQVCSLARAAAAQEISPRPGLWEISASSPLLALVPAIPAERMEQLRSLAREHGFNMPRIENGAASSRVCITPEMARQKTLPNLYQQQSGCSSSNAVREANRYSMDVSCSSDRYRGNGRVEGVIESPERITGRTRFAGTVNGQAVDETADTSARWIAASCGGLQPPR